MKYTAVVLAAGKGSRMNSKVHKQYLMLAGKPVLAYSLEAFERSAVDGIILVTGENEESYCRTEIVERYGLKKVTEIVAGGRERYHSVFEGLKAAAGSDYVLIHDGARPFVTEEMIQKTMQAVREKSACIVGMPVKDTIKISDCENHVLDTPRREYVWTIQTPQAFSYGLIYHAYEQILKRPDCQITDDAMAVEQICKVPVHLIEGSYQNIKITTPEDMLVAEALLRQRSGTGAL